MRAVTSISLPIEIMIELEKRRVSEKFNLSDSISNYLCGVWGIEDSENKTPKNFYMLLEEEQTLNQQMAILTNRLTKIKEAKKEEQEKVIKGKIIH